MAAEAAPPTVVDRSPRDQSVLGEPKGPEFEWAGVPYHAEPRKVVGDISKSMAPAPTIADKVLGHGITKTLLSMPEQKPNHPDHTADTLKYLDEAVKNLSTKDRPGGHVFPGTKVPDYTGLHIKQGTRTLVVFSHERSLDITKERGKATEGLGAVPFIGRRTWARPPKTKFFKGLRHEINLDGAASGSRTLRPTRADVHKEVLAEKDELLAGVYDEYGRLTQIKNFSKKELAAKVHLIHEQNQEERARAVKNKEGDNPKLVSREIWIDGTYDKGHRLEHVKDIEISPSPNISVFDTIIDDQIKHGLENLAGLTLSVAMPGRNGKADAQETIEVLADMLQQKSANGKGFHQNRTLAIRRRNPITGTITTGTITVDELKARLDGVDAMDAKVLAGMDATQFANISERERHELFTQKRSRMHAHFNIPNPTPETFVTPEEREVQDSILRGVINEVMPEDPRETAIREQEGREKARRTYMARFAMGVKPGEEHLETPTLKLKRGNPLYNTRPKREAARKQIQADKEAAYLLIDAENLSEDSRKAQYESIVKTLAKHGKLEAAIAAIPVDPSDKRPHDEKIMEAYVNNVLEPTDPSEQAGLSEKDRDQLRKIQLDQLNEFTSDFRNLQSMLADKGLSETVDMALRVQREVYQSLYDYNIVMDVPESDISWVLNDLAKQHSFNNYPVSKLGFRDNAIKKWWPGFTLGDPFDQDPAHRQTANEAREQLVSRHVGAEFAKAALVYDTEAGQAKAPGQKINRNGMPGYVEQPTTTDPQGLLNRVPKVVESEVEQILKTAEANTKATQGQFQLTPDLERRLGDLLREATNRRN